MDNNADPLQIPLSPTTPTFQTQTAPQPKPDKKPLVILIVGFVVIVIVGSVAYFLNTKKWSTRTEKTLVEVPQVTVSATPLPTATTGSTLIASNKIVNMFVGTVKNPTDSKQEFSVNTSVIYAHVNLNPAPEDVPAKVTAMLVYAATNYQLGPVGVSITTATPQGADFSFTKPNNGWPKGDYKVVVKFGQSTEEYTFVVK